ncbi:MULTISPECIES: dicarboxylate/amino acid:cation symporter [Sphingopyxis]|jgi:Na+/H+-dicarboxylate symporter|uniref:C4-dicarboxylate transport protein n=1 Tax=Sphingopyxis granuli TaxID=267128 RepID=A0AA86L267_9SPHN|nr:MULTISPECIES: dicarboxylate/amino acid:cation symporter [Sphingopyxis]AMG73749.1 C4-dicarboxylate transport protein [Sphingopyxis granuli]APW72223.1 dicarboxylate/amino acid:cation symporter [Sphingopyxis granuli]AVA13058.1 dicarboxylate/amino acid:cation symporter [Sphingopyxis sp. MG]ODU30465.1 MAG: C4-dicarboxylate ABC transporter [Sphingopyxis sp. SCN 67-31]QUM71970.1 dicarboxylate/amino acid:cation symporter [Sphingopyxis granuli]
MAKRLTLYILIGMILGIVAGAISYAQVGADKEAATQVAGYFKLLADVFLQLIKMIIAPLVLATIVAGIANMGDSAALGRIGGRALLWFITASLVSLSLGLLLVNLLQPGVRLDLTPMADIGEVKTDALNLRDFVMHIFPKSIFDAMAQNDILQILVFSLFAGVGLSALGERGAPLVRAADALGELMLQITNYVMLFAPFAVFGALAGVITVNGLGILLDFLRLIVEFYFGLLLLWVVLLALGAIFLGKRILMLVRYIIEPLLLAFSTASSEAALPKLFEQLDRFGVPRRISGFVLPLGYSFNLDGSMMYMSFATLFIAQAYGIDLSIGTQILILLTLMITSKGIAGVPRASLVVITATLAQFGLPVEGVALILGIDQFLDMGRSATNVVGNAVATSVITRWEGMLETADPADMDYPHAPSRTAHRGARGLELQEDMVEDSGPPAAGRT